MTDLGASLWWNPGLYLLIRISTTLTADVTQV